MGKNIISGKWGVLLLFFVIGILPVKAQLYIGGGFNYYKTQESYPDRQIKHFSISPELGYRYHRLAAGLTISYVYNKSQTYNSYSPTGFDNPQEEKSITVEPYIRFDLVAREDFGFFVDAFYSYTHYNNHPTSTYLVGLSPGVYYKLTDRLLALFRFGLVGYSSSYQANDFEGFGASLSMNTSRIGFYYSFW